MPSASKDSIAAQMALDSGTGLTCCFLLCCHKATKKIFAMTPPSQRARATYRREEGLLEAQMCLCLERWNTRLRVLKQQALPLDSTRMLRPGSLFPEKAVSLVEPVPFLQDEIRS